MRTVLISGLSLFALAIVPPAEAGPQEDALEALAACRAIKVEAVQRACMDAANDLLAEARAATPAAPATPAPVAPTAPIVTAPTPPAIDTAAAEKAAAEAAAERAALVAEREALEAERAALATERAAIDAAASAPTTAPAVQGPSLLERLRPASRESAPVQIVKIVRRRRTGKLRFITEDGLVFDQALDRINFQPPSRLPADATISFGALGSKWIRFADEPDRKYKVALAE